MAIYHFLGLLCCLSAVLALQCYTGQLMAPAIPGVTLEPVKLEACPAEATRCANIETVAEITIPNQSPFKTTQKLGQCANETICESTLNCDMAKKSVPGFQSCKAACCSTDKCNGPNLDEAKTIVKGGSGNSGNSGNSVKASFTGAFTFILVAMVFIK